MRWFANSLLVLVGIIFLFFLFTTENLKYTNLAGLVFFSPNNLPQSCAKENLTALWNIIFKESSLNTVFIAGIPTSGGCVDAVLYKHVNEGTSDKIWVLKLDNETTVRILAEYYNISDPSNTLNLSLTNATTIFTILDPIVHTRQHTILDPENASVVANISFNVSTQANNFQVTPDLAFYKDSQVINGFHLNESIFINKTKERNIFHLSSFPLTIRLSGGIIPNFNTSEDTNITNAFNLSQYFSSNVNVLYNFNQDPTGVIFVLNGTFVSFAPLKDWHGLISANVTASYQGIVYQSSNNFTINITPVNDPPRLIQNIPNFTWNSNTNKKINLNDYFSDIDRDILSYSVNNISTILISINPQDGDATFTPTANWTGTVNTTFFARDTSGSAVQSNSVYLTVQSPSNPPPSANMAPEIIAKDPPSSSISLNVGQSRIFEIIVTDPNRDPLFYSWILNGTILNVTSSHYIYTASVPGEFNVTARVTDGYFTKEQSWIIYVTAAEIPPSPPSTVQQPQGVSQIIPRARSPWFYILLIGISIVVISVGGIFIFIFLKKKNIPLAREITEEKKEEEKQEESFFEKLHMEELKPLIVFIKKYKDLGVSEMDIREVLLKKGWSTYLIDDAFRRAQ